MWRMRNLIKWKSEKKSFCPFTGRHSTKKEHCCRVKKYFDLVRLSRSAELKEDGCSEKFRTSSGEKKEKKWWQSCQNDFWALLQGSNRMLEALTWGSAMVWGSETDRQRRKFRLLWRVLWSSPSGTGQVGLGIKDHLLRPGSKTTVDHQSTEPRVGHPVPFTRAIKDAVGAAHDAEVNQSATETLDSAMAEFQEMCTEYTRRNESLLGLHAAEKGDMELAVRHLHSSCMMGNTSACFNLGLCYETGSGVPQNLDKAKLYYNRAASAGHSLASYNLGLLYLAEEPNCKEDSVGGDNAECLCSKERGLNLLDDAARAGLAEAQTYLGIHHMEENQDAQRAVPYFRAAADQNDSEAQYFLAICHEHGLGVEKNECRAAQLYSMSASSGHESALYNLAVFNENGLGGLPVDMVTACELYTKAANLGLDQAKLRLEEIQSQNKAYEANQTPFQSLYELHFREQEFPTPSTRPLSPSASSPTLSQDWNQSFSFYLGKVGVDTRKTGVAEDQNQNFFDPGGGSVSKIVGNGDQSSVRFRLGGEDVSVRSQNSMIVDDGVILKQKIVMPPIGFLHKSFTSPNLATVTGTS